jgi:prepilin-type processing-associated H-X9-DG protein
VAQSEMAVMFDMASSNVREFNHIPGGENVVFMDGHVEFLKFPSEFPCTRAFVSLVSTGSPARANGRAAQKSASIRRNRQAFSIA